MQHAFGLDIPQTLSEVCNPNRLALIVYDMQIAVVNQIPKGQEVIARVSRVVRAARDGGVRVFFSRYMTLPKEIAGVAQLRMAMAWQRATSVDQLQSRFLRDSPGFQIIPELAPLSSEAVFDRITMSAFEGTPLNIALRDCAISAFAIVGVALEVGIEPTVRHGADLGYIPVVVKDACGAGHEGAAQRSLESLSFAGDALITDTETICGLLKQGR